MRNLQKKLMRWDGSEETEGLTENSEIYNRERERAGADKGGEEKSAVFGLKVIELEAA